MSGFFLYGDKPYTDLADLLADDYAEYQAHKDEVVSHGDECPVCGENRLRYLVREDTEPRKCLTCGTIERSVTRAEPCAGGWEKDERDTYHWRHSTLPADWKIIETYHRYPNGYEETVRTSLRSKSNPAGKWGVAFGGTDTAFAKEWLTAQGINADDVPVVRRKFAKPKGERD